MRPKTRLLTVLLVGTTCLAAACGRSQISAQATDGSLAHDQSTADQHQPVPDAGWPPPVDGWLPPTDLGWPSSDVWWPTYDYSPPLGDLTPPRRDGQVPPPPDLWPPHDVMPPPSDGPCAGSCAQICYLLVPCGLSSGGYGKCQNDCAALPSSQRACLKSVVCSVAPSCAAAKSCLPAAKPDLTVVSFVATVSGNTVHYDLTACNQGQGAAGNFYVDVYYHRTSAPKPQDFGEDYAETASLAAGSCVKLSFERVATPAGTYSSWVQIDADGYVAESNENNNVKGPLAVSVAAPPLKGVDLMVSSMKATVSGTTGTSVQYQVSVCNAGTDPAPASAVHVYYNRSAPPKVGQLGDTFTSVPPLAPGACTTRSVTRSGVPQGLYSSYAQVDPANAVAESNEGNNTFGPVAVTVGSTPGADLTIKSFTGAQTASNAVRYQAQVCNQGTGTAGTTVLHVYFNRAVAPKQGESGDQAAVVSQLAPGSCTTVILNRSATPAGSYTSWAQADPANLVPETNEGNNVAGPVTVKVTAPPSFPDLSFKQFDAKASGFQVVYAAVVCNTGTAAASTFGVDIYVNSATPPPSGTGGQHVQTVPSLAVGACATVNYTTSPLSAASVTSWARLDTKAAVAESNENNNLAGPRVVVLGVPTSCTAACAFAIGCGLFGATELQSCMTWCNGLSTVGKQCLMQATSQASCTALKACNLPPPPPPPPPPEVCPDLCSYLTDPCKLLPSGQYWTCVGACQNLSSSKLQCAKDAMAKGQCMQMVQCIF